MVEKVFVDWNTYQGLAHHLCARVPAVKYSYVWGVPRGGCMLASLVASRLGLQQIGELEGYNPKHVLIVDDLIDSGKTKQKYEGYDFEVLINKQTDEKYKGKWVEFFYEKTDSDDTELVIRMLERIGENPNREGLVDTPKRVVKMWGEIFRGYDKEHKPNLTVFNNGKDGLGCNEMIQVEGDFYSHCEHHMVPFFGHYWFAYIPNKKIMGVSKIPRLVQYYAAKLQVQERLTKEVVDDIEKLVEPQGVALVMEAEHLCMSMRGVKSKGKMRTNELRGVFLSKPEARAEFMGWVNK